MHVLEKDLKSSTHASTLGNYRMRSNLSIKQAEMVNKKSKKSVKHKTIKLLEDNTGENLGDLGMTVTF